MNKHTSGSWSYKSGTRDVVVSKDGYNDVLIAQLYKIGSNTEANARLIAAAPDLLAFVKHVIEQIDSGACGYVDGTEAQLRDYAERIIAKAEGKGDDE